MPAARPLRRPFFWFVVTMIALGWLARDTQRLLLTGDEPRYLLYAASMIRHGRLSMGLPEWTRLSGYRTLPIGGSGLLMNGVYLPVLLSPLAGLAGLAGLRAAALAAGIGGLLCLYRLVERDTRDGWIALAAAAVAGFSIPLLPYLDLFYMEAFLFGLLCWAWLRVQVAAASFRADLLTALLLIAVPFVHMRGSVCACLLFALLLLRNLGRGRRREAAILCALAVALGIVFVGLNLRIYGNPAGPVNTARPPTPAAWFPVLAMQCFNSRHGLLAYSPVWLVGYAGLWLSLRPAPARGPHWTDHLTLGRQALVLATAAALTGVGINPGECWPARFWVQSVPMLAVGLALWWRAVPSRAPRAVALALAAVTAINTRLFLHSSNAFLLNRQFSVTWQSLFDRFVTFDVALVLPVEVPDSANGTVAAFLALASLVVLASLVAAAWSRWWALPAVLLLAAAVDLTRFSRMDPHAYAVAASPARLVVTFDTPVRAVSLRLGDDRLTAYARPGDTLLSVDATSGGRRYDELIANAHVIAVDCAAPVQRIAVDTSGGSTDLAAEAARDLAVYRSRSILLPVFERVFGGCRGLAPRPF